MSEGIQLPRSRHRKMLFAAGNATLSRSATSIQKLLNLTT